jgi:hypothetical protein
MSNTTLVSLALLKARYEKEGTDFLESLFPFVSYVLSNEGISEFNSKELQELLYNEFNILIPQHTLTLLANRLKKKGVIKKENKKYNVIGIENKNEEFTENRAILNKHYNTTVEALIKYALSNLKIDIDKDEAEEFLLTYIDDYSIECVKAYQCGEVVPIRGKRKKENWRYIVSSFVSEISASDPAKFEYLVTVIKGRMLANALLGSDLSEVSMKFKKTVLYIDTPIILQLINVLGGEAYTLAEEMIELFKNANAQLAIFEHNFEEVNLILKNAEKYLNYETGGYGNVVLTMRDLGKKPSDIALLRSQLLDHLKHYNIELYDTPKYSTDCQIDEEKLEKEMKASGLNYSNEKAKLVDINSVRSIYILRKGLKAKRVEDCGAILVTNNSAFSRSAYSYGCNHEELKSISAVITDFSLTNIVWLKSPLSSNDIPKKFLIRDCYAALRPSDSLWSSFIDEIIKLEKNQRITPEQHKFLRYELRVRKDLMNLTLGDEENLSDDQIFLILERHEQEIIKPWKDRYANSEEEFNKIQKELSLRNNEIETIHSRIEALGLYIEKAINVFLLVICMLFSFYALGWLDFLGKSGQTMFKTWQFVASIFFNFLCIISLIFGFIIINPISCLSRGANKLFVGIISYFLIPKKEKGNTKNGS